MPVHLNDGGSLSHKKTSKNHNLCTPVSVPDISLRIESYLLLYFWHDLLIAMGKSSRVPGKGKRNGNQPTSTSFSNDKKKDKAKHSKRTKKDYQSPSEVRFSKLLYDLGYDICVVDGDGNCLFRSIADQLLGDANRHVEIRSKIVSYIDEHKDHFSMFLEDDECFDDYLARMKDPGEWGGHQELYAASQCLNAHIVVHQLDAPRYKLQAGQANSTTEIVLSYHGDCHYNSVKRRSDWTPPDPEPAATNKTAAKNSNAVKNKTASLKAEVGGDAARELVVQTLSWVSAEEVDRALLAARGAADEAIELLCAGMSTLSTAVAAVLGSQDSPASVIASESHRPATPTQNPKHDPQSETVTEESSQLQLDSNHKDSGAKAPVSGTQAKARSKQRRGASDDSAPLNAKGRPLSKKEQRQRDRQQAAKGTAPSGVVVATGGTCADGADSHPWVVGEGLLEITL